MAFEHINSDPAFEDIASLYLCNEQSCVERLAKVADLSPPERSKIENIANELIDGLRSDSQKLPMVDALLQEYDLSSVEGVELMRLSEALIRTPDFDNSRFLIRDKLHKGDWLSHIGRDRPLLVNISSLGLAFSKLWINLSGGVYRTNKVAKIGDHALAFFVNKTMALTAKHFVLGTNIENAIERAELFSAKGYSFSFDMLGEAALTHADAEIYFEKYSHTVQSLKSSANNAATNSNISIKLSALHPRYEHPQLEECGPPLVEKLVRICEIAKSGGLTVTIDAEEVDRLEASLSIFEQAFSAPSLKGWDGLGLVVQAYQKRAPAVLNWLIGLAKKHDKCIPIRLVKGAYWDTEIKRAQELGLQDYPVFTQKEHTDISYIACARLLLNAGNTVYPQFATHNAHTSATIMHMAGDARAFEFQRLHGMGENLHDELIARYGVESRIYAPVGAHKELLPYLVRRLLENGANSSFVNQLQNPEINTKAIAQDPFTQAQKNDYQSNINIGAPRDLFNAERLAASGADWTQLQAGGDLEKAASSHKFFHAHPLISTDTQNGDQLSITNPVLSNVEVGTVEEATTQQIHDAVIAAKNSSWGDPDFAKERVRIINHTADLLEQELPEFISLCVAEAGKTIPDAIAEIREAIDFCRYYAFQAHTKKLQTRSPIGIVACISPWNFPLAIFLGQIVANLSVGNRVIAKPADQTPLIAYNIVQLMLKAGVHPDALSLTPGSGAKIGTALTRHEGIDGVCFTGSTATAKIIHENLIETGRGAIPFIAETGGINAMIIDSTALMEQAVRDIVISAFQSAGQRCSACRLVCIQEDIAEDFEKMLKGAIETLTLGNPAMLDTDIGPVIDADAHQKIKGYILDKKKQWTVIGEAAPAPSDFDNMIAPIAFRINKINELRSEIFGPVLHVVRYGAKDMTAIINDINKLGYGLTMGLHTRIDARASAVAQQAHIGNLYVNRNQIGAVVGVQPFGGEGLSGTGPKAGGPHYLMRLTKSKNPAAATVPTEQTSPSQVTHNGEKLSIASQPLEEILMASQKAQKLWSQNFTSEARTKRIELVHPALTGKAENFQTLEETNLPGPTGETNRLRLVPRGVFLVLASDDPEIRAKQIFKSLIAGNSLIIVVDDQLAHSFDMNFSPNMPEGLIQFVTWDHIKNKGIQDIQIDGIVTDGPRQEKAIALTRAAEGPIIPLLFANDELERFCLERVITIDTTAAGGNATLMTIS